MGSIELPEHPDLLRELRAIRTRYSAGRSSVVLPRLGGSHCDLAQALALEVLEHDRRGLGGRGPRPAGRLRDVLAGRPASTLPTDTAARTPGQLVAPKDGHAVESSGL